MRACEYAGSKIERYATRLAAVKTREYYCSSSERVCSADGTTIVPRYIILIAGTRILIPEYDNNIIMA